MTLIASSDCEIGFRINGQTCYLRPQEARQLAAQLSKIADEIEGNEVTDLITMSEAAELIRGEVTQATQSYVNSLVLRGKLKRYEDKTEPNPQRRGRVSREDVMKLVRTEYS